jgi:hypothetical protein
MYWFEASPQIDTSTASMECGGSHTVCGTSLWIIQNSGDPPFDDFSRLIEGDPLDGWILQVLAGKSGSESLGAQRGDKCLDRLDDFSDCGEGLEKNLWYALDGYDSFVLYYICLYHYYILLYTIIIYNIRMHVHIHLLTYINRNICTIWISPDAGCKNICKPSRSQCCCRWRQTGFNGTSCCGKQCALIWGWRSHSDSTKSYVYKLCYLVTWVTWSRSPVVTSREVWLAWVGCCSKRSAPSWMIRLYWWTKQRQNHILATNCYMFSHCKQSV